MSRTHRRKTYISTNKSYIDLYWFVTDTIWSSPFNAYYRIQYDKKSKEYRKGKA